MCVLLRFEAEPTFSEGYYRCVVPETAHVRHTRFTRDACTGFTARHLIEFDDEYVDDGEVLQAVNGELQRTIAGVFPESSGNCTGRR